MNDFIKSNWKALALISSLVVSGATGYTNLLLELGELRAEVNYLNDSLTALSEQTCD